VILNGIWASAMNPSPDNPVCKKCGLYNGCKSPFMPAHGASNPRIIIIGEAPGSDEDDEGVPFVGQSGHLLRDTLDGLGIDIENDVLFTNVVRCRPPDNKITRQAIQACKQFAIADIYKFVEGDLSDFPAGQYVRLEQVWLMGNSPLNGILGESGITSWNGNIIEKDGLKFVPLYHPAYILRDNSHMDDWLSAMMNALDGNDTHSDRYEIIIVDTIAKARLMRADLRRHKIISFDTEVSSLDPFAEEQLLLSVSFACPDGRAYTIPMDHPETPWSDRDYAEVAGIIIDILRSEPIIGHNVKFDQNQTRALLQTKFDAVGDTMIISHLLDSRQGIHGLKHLAGQYLGMYEYEQELTDYVKGHKECAVGKGGSYAFVPLKVLLPYGAMDAEATLKLHDELYPQLSDKQKILYNDIALPVSNVLARMQYNGIKIDQYIAERYVKIYRKRQGDVLKDVLNDKKVRKMTADRGDEKYTFNPNSSKQVSELYFEYYGIPVQGETESGNASTSAKLMKPLEEKYPIVKLVRYYKLLSKMLGTYLEPACTEWPSADGRVRTTYNLHGTVTGRLSSSSPNLQNIPTPEKEPGTLLETLPIKNVFTHTWKGGCLEAFDYSGMELRIFASMARCQGMIDIHKSGLDFHSMVAIMSTERKPIKEIDPDYVKWFKKNRVEVRYRYKWTNWTLLYGGDARTLANLYDVPTDEAEQTVKMYYDLFPEVLDYQNECKEFAKEHGYIESPFGRREHLPYINDRNAGKANADARAAVNMPIQSAASDTLLCALVIIDARMKTERMQSMLINTVHDSILVDVYPGELLPMKALVTDSMENVKTLAEDYMPNVDFSWLICPLKADADAGSHYGSLMEVDEWLKKNPKC
jgi:DNA polymerase I